MKKKKERKARISKSCETVVFRLYQSAMSFFGLIRCAFHARQNVREERERCVKLCQDYLDTLNKCIDAILRWSSDDDETRMEANEKVIKSYFDEGGRIKYITIYIYE